MDLGSGIRRAKGEWKKMIAVKDIMIEMRHGWCTDRGKDKKRERRKNCQQAELHYERPSAKHQNTHLPREILRFLQKPIEFRRFFQTELQQIHSPAAQNSNNFLELLAKSVEKKRQDENLKSQLNTSELIRQMPLKSTKKVAMFKTLKQENV